MFFLSFLTRPQGRRPQPQPYRFRPTLEVLEGRALPSTLMVTNTRDTGVSGDGSLRGEIAAAASGDTIEFAGSVIHGQPITLTSGQPLTITQNLEIEGPVGNPIVISGNNFTTVFVIESGTVTLSGLTITNGSSHDLGGGIGNFGTLTVSHCTLSGNTAYVGGGIANFGTLTVSQSTLSGNSAVYGGGGIFNDGTLTVTQSTLSGNTAGIGGGIANFGTLTVSQSTLSGNTAYDGGGIFNGNVFGGAATLTVSQSTLSGNSAFDAGGGIYNYTGATLNVLDHSSITGDTPNNVTNLGTLNKDDSSTIGP